MSATIIILPVIPVVRTADPPSKDSDSPVADIRIAERQQMQVYGYTAGEMGIPLVMMRCGALFYGDLNLAVEQAEKIAAGLLKAVAKARGNSAK